MNRRKFLKQSMSQLGGAFFLASPLEIMLGNIVSGFFQRAWALEQGDNGFLDKKLVSISLAGGASRWMYDLPLRPSPSDPFQYNATNDPKTSMLITRLLPDPTGPGGFVGEYATTQIGNYQLPIMWAGKMATVNGGTENMSALAQNMLFMRGLKSVDNHNLGRVMQSKPGGGFSLGGLVADRATSVLPALSMGMLTGTFKSAKGIVPQDVGSDDPLTVAFQPFLSAGALRSNAAGTAAAIDQVLDLMRAKAGSRHKMVPFTYADRINARKLMTTQFNNLSGAFTTLRTKYRDLISRSLGEVALRQAGVDDVAAAGSSIGQFRIQDTVAANTFYTGQDLSSITDSTTMIGRLAEAMAVAEFMILGGGGTMDQSFSSTLHVELGSMSNCIFDSMVAAGVTSANKRFALVTDAHQSGSYMQLVQFTRYYRAISSCVFELVRKIKEKQIGSGTLFDRTLITLHSEFNRSARDAGDGADHGPNGSCYSIISGMVPAPIVVGNIKKDGGSNNYRGTWGNGAPMVEFTNQQAVVGNAVSTVAMMLGVPSPAPNNASFVSLNPSSGKVSPAVGLPRNIA